MRRAFLLGLVTLATAVVPARAQTAPAAETLLAAGQARTIPMAAGTLLRIRGAVGEVAITRASGPDAVVTASYADGAAAPKVVLIPDGTGTTVCSVHASPNPKKPNECLAGNKGRLIEGLKRDWVPVRFEVQVPDGVDVSAELADGNITADTGSGKVWLKTFKVDLAITDHGARDLQGEVFSGSMKVTVGAESPHPLRRVTLGISGGEMRVEVPARTASIHYTISADANIRTPFKLAAGSGLRMGDFGREGPTTINLSLNTSSPLAKIVLVPLADQAK